MNNFISCVYNWFEMRWMLIFFIGFVGICAHSQNESRIETDEFTFRLPPLDNKAKRTEIEAYNQGNNGLKFAYSHKTQLTPQKNGHWDKTNADQLVWKQHILSEGAYALSLGFNQFSLTPSSRLWIYNPDKSVIIGPLNATDNDSHGEFWTPLISGDELILKLEIPPDELEGLLLEIAFINHDFTGINNRISGSCNLDVQCGAADGWPEVDPYRDIVRSVGAYFFMDVNDPFPGLSICTGTLMNNTREDCTPYFLTAFHCLGGDPSNPIEETAPSLVFIWNFENSTCRQPNSPESGSEGDGSFTLFNTGSQLRSSNQFTDFILLELDDPVSESAHPFFAGWDATNGLPLSTICVHHPGVEEKRISFDFDASEYRFTTLDTLFLRVNNWEIGTTEGGSSGAPLFNQDKQVVGQLFGGLASCSNNSWDNFGWFHRSWEGSGTPESRLKDWLDPDQSGTLTLNGKECSYFIELSENDIALCSGNLDTITIVAKLSQSFPDTTLINIGNLPDGLSVTVDSNPVIGDHIANLIFTADSGTTEGEYALEVSGLKNGIQGKVNLTVQVYRDLPSAPVLLDPENSAEGVTTFLDLGWSDDRASNFDLQVSRIPNFAVVDLDLQDLTAPYFFAQNLNANTTYYWRVRTLNKCGFSNWSEIFQFRTNDTRCFTYNADDTPVTIGTEGPNDIQSKIYIRQSGIVVDVNISALTGNHTWLDDLTFILENPNKDSVTLLQNICGPLDNFDIQFDEQELSSNYPCPYTDGNIYNPLGSLSDFNEQSPRGDWTLIVSDNAQGDGGSLESWSLDICIDVSNDFSVFPDLDTIVLCAQEEVSNIIRIGSAFNGQVELSAVNPIDGINYEFSINPTGPDSDVELTISGLNLIPSGIYTIEYLASDSQKEATGKFILDIDNGPEKPVLVQPADHLMNVDLSPSFNWATSAINGDYLFELSLDSLFNQIVISNSLDSLNLTLETELLEETKYFWRITTSNECGTSVSDIFRFTTTFDSKVFEIENNSFNVFPNPVSDNLKIKVAGSPLDVKLEIYTLKGEKIISSHLTIEDEHSINLSELTPGIYFVRISKDQSSVLYRLIKI